MEYIVFRAAVGLDPLIVAPIYYRTRGAEKFYSYTGKNKITRRGFGGCKKNKAKYHLYNM